MNDKEQKFYNNLRRGGKWLYRHKLIFYDELFDDIDFSWKYWHVCGRIVCFFKGHKPEQMWRLPKDDEVGLADEMGCVSAGMICTRCWKDIIEVISLGIPKNESLEEYNKRMEEIADETLSCMDEEDKRQKHLK